MTTTPSRLKTLVSQNALGFLQTFVLTVVRSLAWSHLVWSLEILFPQDFVCTLHRTWVLLPLHSHLPFPNSSQIYSFFLNQLYLRKRFRMASSFSQQRMKLYAQLLSILGFGVALARTGLVCTVTTAVSSYD